MRVVRVACCLLVALFAAAVRPACAAQTNGAEGHVQPTVRAVASGGTVTFGGAVVVGTASTVAAGTSMYAGAIGHRTRTKHFDDPPRTVSFRRMAPAETSSRIRRLERAGERFGARLEALVSYQ